jgi:hypothetical protein
MDGRIFNPKIDGEQFYQNRVVDIFSFSSLNPPSSATVNESRVRSLFIFPFHALIFCI